MDGYLLVKIFTILAILFIGYFWRKLFLAVRHKDQAKMKKYVKGAIIFLCIWIIFFSVDFVRTKNQKSPIFARFSYGTESANGSLMYYGLGYKVILFHEILNYDERIDINCTSAHYYYICSWWPSYDTAWKKIKNETIEYNYQQWLQNNSNN